MSELYEDMLAAAVRALHELMTDNDAARVEVLNSGLRVAVAIGWPDGEEEDDE